MFGLPNRSRCGNSAVATAAPAAFHLIATRPAGADACEVLLAGDFEGEFAGARRHALHVLQGLAQRYPGAGVDVQLLDGSGTPLFVCTDCTGGAL